MGVRVVSIKLGKMRLNLVNNVIFNVFDLVLPAGYWWLSCADGRSGHWVGLARCWGLRELKAKKYPGEPGHKSGY